MPETNARLEAEVEKIVVTKARLIWGVISTVAILFGAFMSVQVQLARNEQKLDYIADAITEHKQLTVNDQQRIAALEAIVFNKK